MIEDFPTCPIGDYKGHAWDDVPSSFLRWMIGTDDSGEPCCDYVAHRPALRTVVKAELARRDRPEGSITFPGFDLSL